jgi:hypothetical protein
VEEIAKVGLSHHFRAFQVARFDPEDRIWSVLAAIYDTGGDLHFRWHIYFLVWADFQASIW